MDFYFNIESYSGDCLSALQSAVNEAVGGVLHISDGEYTLNGTLFLPSKTTLSASKNAHFMHGKDFPKKRGDFLLCNSDTVNGNSDISVTGGIWDGCYDSETNTKCGDLFDVCGCSGSVINFTGVNGLTLHDITVANSVVYFIRLGRVDGFLFEKIRFSAEKLSFNQDGLHFSGGCRNGTVRDVRAITDGETNDDMIALNADDCVTRIENLDLTRDTIENITFCDIYAENCYTFARLLSVGSSIKNITFENIYAGCRNYLINMDGARYCRTPLFSEDEYPNGSGNIENVLFKNVEYFCSQPGSKMPLIMAETACSNLRLENCSRLFEKEKENSASTLAAKNLVNTVLTINGSERTVLTEKGDRIVFSGNITSLTVDKL